MGLHCLLLMQLKIDDRMIPTGISEMWAIGSIFSVSEMTISGIHRAQFRWAQRIPSLKNNTSATVSNNDHNCSYNQSLNLVHQIYFNHYSSSISQKSLYSTQHPNYTVASAPPSRLSLRKQKCLQWSTEFAKLSVWPSQFRRQAVPDLGAGSGETVVAKTGTGPRDDACVHVSRAQTAAKLTGYYN